jgi:hypothetical protein
MRAPVKATIYLIVGVALLCGAFRHDIRGTRPFPAGISPGKPSLTADVILTKYPYLPEQVVRQRLRELTRLDWGSDAIDCTGSANVGAQLSCATSALENVKPFYVNYRSNIAAYGLVGDGSGRVYMVTYRVYPFAPIPPDRYTRILDQGHTVLTECVPPVTLGQTSDSMVACITPTNQDLSARAASQDPVETTLCAIADDPASFNNKLVRVHGDVSGNFEYSTIEERGCKADIWFAYPHDNGEGPPGLAAYVTGSAVPGAEDSEGRRILPVPLKLVRDDNFERFQKLMEARVKADDVSYASDHKNPMFHCVTATFIGRIDGVSPEIYRFHKKRLSTDHADYLGYGQMGQFDAQLVMKSVEDHAVLSTCSE